MTMDNSVEGGRAQRAAMALRAFFENKLNIPVRLLLEAPPTAADGDVAFELEFVPVWGVRAERVLTQMEREDVVRTFRSVLEAVGTESSRRSEAERVHGRLLQAMDEAPSNVVPLRRRAGGATRVRPTSFSTDRKWTLRLDCLIEAQFVSEVHKMAVELHAHSGRPSFVDFRDLDAARRLEISSLLSLGNLTLFIPDVLFLKPEEQATLGHLTALDPTDRPLVMAGTTLPYPELRAAPGIDIHLLETLARAYIKLTRPFVEYRDQGLIHYFLDSLSESRE